LPDFLSPAWIEACDAAVTAAGLASPERFVVQNRVSGDGAVVSYHLVVDSNGARVNEGDHPDPTVTYSLGSATAQGIASGELDPYEEFMAGRLEISGDSSTLVDNQHLLESLQAAIAGV